MKGYLIILLPLIIGSLSGVLFGNGIAKNQMWFARLEKPAINPPGYLFGIVWPILYLMIGISYFIIYNSPDPRADYALLVGAIQLILNFIWTPIFFNYHRIDIALINIIALWVLIIYTSVLFSRINMTASQLLIPYLLWVSFATILNYKFYKLNK